MRKLATQGRCPVCRQRTVYPGRVSLVVGASLVVDVDGLWLPITCGDGRHKLEDVCKAMGGTAPSGLPPDMRVRTQAIVLPLPEAC